MPTRYRGPEDEIRALNTYITLVRSVNSVNSGLGIHFRGYGLTETQFGVLEALHHVGPMYQGQLGEKLLKSGGNMTLVIDNLERRKLVRRERDPDDRRFVRVVLTKKGQDLITEIFPRHAAAIRDTMAALTPDEQEQLRSLARKLGRAAQGHSSSE